MSAVMLAGVLVFAGQGLADVSVEVHVKPALTPFHRQISYSIVVEHPVELKPELPDMLNRFGGLSIYGTPAYETEDLGNGRRRVTETYTLDPVYIGMYTIDPVVVSWGDGDEIVVASPGVRVRDLTEAEREAAEQFDSTLSEPEYPGPPWFRRWEFWAVIVLAALVVSAATAYWLRNRPKIERTAPGKTPWEMAYERLQSLDERHLPKAAQYEPYYVDLSAILRYYIEDRFHLHAPEQTTPEFLAELSGSGYLDDGHERFLGTFLRHCDLVKFAQYVPTVNDMESRFTEVLRFVDDTVPARDEEKEDSPEAAAA